MAANPDLVKERGISDENVSINEIHETLELLIDTYSLECDYDSTYDLITQAEFALQQLWGFTTDPRFHTWVSKLRYKHMQLTWIGRTFMCNDTGETRTVDKTVYECSLIGVGNGFIDVGRAGAYHRVVGNITEVVDHMTPDQLKLIRDTVDIEVITGIEPRVLYNSEPVPSF